MKVAASVTKECGWDLSALGLGGEGGAEVGEGDAEGVAPGEGG